MQINSPTSIGKTTLKRETTGSDLKVQEPETVERKQISRPVTIENGVTLNEDARGYSSPFSAGVASVGMPARPETTELDIDKSNQMIAMPTSAAHSTLKLTHPEFETGAENSKAK